MRYARICLFFNVVFIYLFTGDENEDILLINVPSHQVKVCVSSLIRLTPVDGYVDITFFY